MEELISVIIKESDKKPKRITVKNTLRALQQTVNGHIEVVGLGDRVVLIVNEEGIPLGLPYNCTFMGHRIFGTMILAGVDGEDFASLPYEIELEEGRNDLSAK